MTRRAVHLSWLLCLLCTPLAAGAYSSWQVRTFPEGSGNRISTTSSASLRVFGSFSGGRVWDTFNAGLSGSQTSSTLPFPADSIESVSDGGEMVVYRGKAWVREYPAWRYEELPDSIGYLTAAFGRNEIPDVCGTSAGTVYMRGNDTSRLLRIGDFPGFTVQRFYGLDRENFRLLRSDGKVLCYDGSWTESPMRAIAAGFWDNTVGCAIEAATFSLWMTTDGGLHWDVASETLADSSLSSWAARARGISIDRDGHGVIPCGDAVLVTLDKGQSWTVAAHGVGMFMDAAVDPQGQILTVGRRLHRCASGSSSVEQVMGGDFSHVTMGSSAVLWNIDGGLVLSIDQGGRWFRQPIPDAPDRLLRAAALGEYDLWLHFDGAEGSRTFRTRDRGNTYIPLDRAGMLHGAIAWSVPDTACAWAATPETILRSMDGGVHWTMVRDRLDQVQALVAPDSLHAAVRTATAFLTTADGGAHWTEGPLPPAGAFTALAFAPGGAWIATGEGVYRATPTTPWEMTAAVGVGDTLRDLSVGPGGDAWAVGTHGLIVGSQDAGRTWEPYRLNVELNAIDGTFEQLSFLQAGSGVTGAGARLVRFLPDRTGPIFRIGVSGNPFIPRYIDIHVTARERLQGDSLHIDIDGVRVPATILDAEGALFRARFKVPSAPGEQLLTVSGRDWGGNERNDARALLALALDRGGSVSTRWRGVPILAQVEPSATVILMELAAEEPAELPDAPLLCAPFSITTDGTAWIDTGNPDAAMVRWDGTAWTSADGIPALPGTREVRAIIERGAAASRKDPLLVYPVPNRGACTLTWTGPVDAPVHWEVFDVRGRMVSKGDLSTRGERSIAWRAVDAAGHALPSGVYWLRASAGNADAVRKILIER
jgi:hypothetical protein